MASINTNYGAAIALQNLNKTSSELERTQNRINTGMKVSSAKDSGAIFSIATSQRAAAASQDAVRSSIQRGQSIVDVALAAGDTITSALEEQKGLAVSIAGSTGAAQTSYLAEYNAIGTEIASALAGATFDGVNLYKANAAAITVQTGASTSYTLKAIAGADTAVATTTAAVAGDAATIVATVDSAITAFTSVLSDFGTKSKSLGRSITFVNKLQDALEAGVGNLVDADLAKESAKLTALQTKQQLGVQALSIANSASQTLLSLFR
ncbi:MULTISPECIES: flagellin [Brevundimonas]|jgi:flagellin|uniref:Flagellin n=2 Tax=Brevundimonas mediterranea TaxID=74329 RepID=A0A6G7EF58_9CAUL|nr:MULTISPECIES: flagellin [Brevundimonas]EDX80029.1 Bacterial flagellin C-terminus domain protein [Brevundimonas sp. BAL3]QIH71987.1 flagellin [Brevundimonas mediterranea]VDC48615.1 Flagellin [Brevundimonas mediterranea]